MRQASSTLAFAGLLAGLFAAGCIEPHKGSHIQMFLTNVRTPCEELVDAGLEGTQKCAPGTNLEVKLKNRFLYHYELWGTASQSGVFHLASFTVQPQLYPDELMQMDTDGVRDSRGNEILIDHRKHFAAMTAEEQETAKSDMNRVLSLNAITTFSTQIFQSSPGKEKWLADDFYLGGYRDIVFTHNGYLFGHVAGTHPYGGSPIGGAQVVVAPNLIDLNSLMITIEEGEPVRAGQTPSSFVLMRGVVERKARGVFNVTALSQIDPEVRGSFAVLAGLGEEEYF